MTKYYPDWYSNDYFMNKEMAYKIFECITWQHKPLVVRETFEDVKQLSHINFCKVPKEHILLVRKANNFFHVVALFFNKLVHNINFCLYIYFFYSSNHTFTVSSYLWFLCLLIVIERTLHDFFKILLPEYWYVCEWMICTCQKNNFCRVWKNVNFICN